jgi:hypothetical protein
MLNNQGNANMALNDPRCSVDKIMAFESGEMNTQDEIIDFFQGLIDTGMAWQLQGSYGRAANSLIEAGHCSPPETKPRNAYYPAEGA